MLKRCFAVFSIGLLMAACAGASASAFAADDPYCLPDPAVEGYVGAAEMGALREKASVAPASAAFVGLGSEDAPVVAEALRVGPRGGVFAARLLRDLAIIEAFAGQEKCGAGDCRKPEIIAGFKTGGERDPNAERSWRDLIVRWREFRDADAAKGRPCLTVSKSRPDYVVEVAEAPASGPSDSSSESLPVPAPDSASDKPASPPWVTLSPVVKPVDANEVARAAAERERTCRDGVVAFLGGFGPVRFAVASARVGAVDKAMLGKLGAMVSESDCGKIVVAVEGHADSDGPKRYNQRLSVRRAKAVADAMGGAAERVSMVGFGESRPAAANDTRAHKAMNRRVEIRIR